MWSVHPDSLRVAQALGSLLRRGASQGRPIVQALALGVFCACDGGDPVASPAAVDRRGVAPRPKSAGPPGPLYRDVASKVGLAFVHFNGMSGQHYLPEVMGAGGALFDADGDGDLDVYLVQGTLLDAGGAAPLRALPTAPNDRLFRNLLRETGTLQFEDVTVAAGTEASGYGMGVATGDIDGDGDIDLYVTNLRDNQLWRNHGDGTFEDATATSGVNDPRWSVPAVFFDLDQDRDLDLFVGNYVDFNRGTHTVCRSGSGREDWCGPASFRPEPDRLLRNRGDGTFEDVTDALGLGGEFGNALGALAADLDGDGRQDLFVANDWTPNQMWIRTDEGFENRAVLGGTALSGAGVAEAGMGVDAADFDRDGDEDLIVAHLTGETNTLYVNEGGGFFRDGTDAAGLGAASWAATGFGTGWIDADRDGWLDLLTVNGAIRRIEGGTYAATDYPLGQSNSLLRSRRGSAFVEAHGLLGPEGAALEVSRGAAFGDVDDDGDTDVLVTHNSGPARLLLHEAAPSAWVGLDVRAPSGAPALGCRLEVRTALPSGEALFVAVTRSARSYASASDPRVLLSLGDATAVLGVATACPGYATREHGPVELDRYHRVEVR